MESDIMVLSAIGQRRSQNTFVSSALDFLCLFSITHEMHKKINLLLTIKVIEYNKLTWLVYFVDVKINIKTQQLYFSFLFLTFRLLSVLQGHSFFSSPPQRPMTSDFEGFSTPDFIHCIYFPILILEKEPVVSLLNVQC